MATLKYIYNEDDEKNIDIEDTIHDKLTFEQIEEMRILFFNNNKTFSYDEFRDILELFNIKMKTDYQYKKLFLKINLDSDASVNWNEFISYLLFCFKQDDSQSQKDSLVLPISMEPVNKNGCHKTPIIGISLLEIFCDDDDEAFGSYITASKDGYINFWSPELEISKSGTSKSQYLKYTPTWVLDVIALSDVQVICVSSTERELRFYDVMATNFLLRLIIRSVPNAICKMNYLFTTIKRDVNSKLLLGDMNGNVYIIEFSPILRGPFQSKPGSMLMEFTWHELLKNKFTALMVKEYKNVFSQFITAMLYSLKYDTLYISADGQGHTGGLLIIDSRENRIRLNIPEGVSTFALDEQHRILATGGPDTYLRLWDPFLPAKATAILTGHHAGIIYIFIQSEECKCYSIDNAKIIKVWHLLDLTLLQTYSELNTIIPNETALSYMYNKAGHELLVGGRKLISIKCCLKTKLDLTDGYTHTAAISVVLYNHLYENIVTCGLDSYIIVWDYWTGKRLTVMKGCHTKESMGETIDLEITAATFDPARQYLLTGARDGSLKVWNYNIGVCIRNMKIEDGCEVTAVAWIIDRILVVSWNLDVTEFADTPDGQYTDPKYWFRVHTEDITAAAYKIGETFVTGSDGGELILWKIETGQPYRKYNVKHPYQYIPIIIDSKISRSKVTPKKQPRLDMAHLFLHSVSDILQTGSVKKKGRHKHSLGSQSITQSLRDLKADIESKKKNIRRMDSRGVIMPLPPIIRETSVILEPKLGIQAILFLKSRPQSKHHGSIVVSLDNGHIQFYSHHQGGGFIDQFYAIHKSGDNVLSLATDKSNKYLFTGTAFGYLKVWLLKNFCIPKLEQSYVCMPLLRLQFSFLMNERILGRAKRVARNREPMLLNSYKAHLSGITSIVYIEHSKIVVTGSNDYSVRMWTLSGRYMGTVGGIVPIIELDRGKEVENIFRPIDFNRFRIPPDINKVGSSTTMRVISGKQPDIFKEYIRQSIEQKDIENIMDKELDYTNIYRPSHRQLCSARTKIFNINKLKDPLLGKQFKFNECCLSKKIPVMDNSLPHIPVYTHLNVHDAKIIERPRTPEQLKKVKNLDFLSYYKKKK